MWHYIGNRAHAMCPYEEKRAHPVCPYSGLLLTSIQLWLPPGTGVCGASFRLCASTVFWIALGAV